jgi:hypothetical protein
VDPGDKGAGLCSEPGRRHERPHRHHNAEDVVSVAQGSDEAWVFPRNMRHAEWVEYLADIPDRRYRDWLWEQRRREEKFTDQDRERIALALFQASMAPMPGRADACTGCGYRLDPILLTAGVHPGCAPC